MFRAFDVRGLSFLVIRKRQAQGSHAKSVKNAARFHVTVGLRVPLRQHHDGRARLVLSFALWRKQARMHRIVFNRRGLNYARPRQVISVKMPRSEEHTSELQSLAYLVCRLLLEKKKKKIDINSI